MKTALTRIVTTALTSPALRATRRAAHGMNRTLRGGPATVHYFHDPADPYSHLTAQILRSVLDRYRIVVAPHLVLPPDAGAAPDELRLATWSRRDAALLADAYALEFPANATDPDADMVQHLAAVLAAAITPGEFFVKAAAGGRYLWANDQIARKYLFDIPGATSAQTTASLTEGDALRRRLGHYLGATLYFEGEWYWGIDRLHHLETRLAALGLDKTPGLPPCAPVRDITLASPAGAARGRVLHMFLSFRSPYSYIALPRARALAAHTGAELRLRFVLPMVMRGLAVPLAKRTYITLDTKREAERLGLPFGTIIDPVGKGVERGLAVLHHAIAAGKGEAFAHSFLQGVFADGINAAAEPGLNKIAACAGIDEAGVQAALADPTWRDVAEANRTEMLANGLWGVPCFRVDSGPLLWGQDRLWKLENHLGS